MSAQCRCGASIFWADSVNGKKMPMDSAPDPAGTFKLKDRPGENSVAIAVKGAELATAPRLYACHWDSSPNCKPVRAAKV